MRPTWVSEIKTNASRPIGSIIPKTPVLERRGAAAVEPNLRVEATTAPVTSPLWRGEANERNASAFIAGIRLKKPWSWRLHDALVNNWRIPKKKVPNTLNILQPNQTLGARANNADVDFFLDPENARRFLEVQKIFPLCGDARPGSSAEPLTATMLLQNQVSIESIVLEHNVLLATETQKVLNTFLAHHRAPMADGQEGFALSFLGRFAKRAQWLDFKKLPPLTKTLQSLGLDNKTIGDFLLYSKAFVPRPDSSRRGFANVSEQIQEPSFAQRYRAVASVFESANIESSGMVALNMTLNLPEPFDESLAALRNLQQWLPESKSSPHHFATSLAPRFLTSPLREAIVHPQFPAFTDELRRKHNIAFNGALALEEAVGLFSAVQSDDKAKKQLISPSFAEAIDFVRDNQLGEALPLRSILEIANVFDREGAALLLNAFGDTNSRMAGDAFLAAALSSNDQVQRLANRRAFLIGELQPLLKRRKALTRSHLPENLVNYTERPRLTELPTSFLLRGLLLARAFNNAANNDVSKVSGKIIRCDIADKTTEYGGRIDISPDSLLRLTEIPGVPVSEVLGLSADHAINDGSYYDPSGLSRQPGLASFHLHALKEDLSSYAGPSISFGIHAADISLWSTNRQPGVVITPLGHPEGRDGKPNKKLIRINVDLYMKTDSQTEKLPFKPLVLDLGTYTVPYPTSDKHCSS